MDDARTLIDIAAIRSLPRSTTPWQMSFRPAPKEADRAGMYRLLIIVSAGANTIRLMRATTDSSLPPDVIVSALEDAMTQVEGDLVPARPPKVLVDDAALLEAIQLPMRSCGVEVDLQDPLPAIDPVLDALGKKPGLFSDRTLIGAACFEAELAEAAARVAGAEPWRYFIEELPIAVHLDDGPANIVVVMGTMGQLHGIACYDEATYSKAMEVQAAPPAPRSPVMFNGWSLVLEPACSTTSTQRRALIARGLPVAHALYPQFRHFRAGERSGEITDRMAARNVQRILHAVVALIEECGDRLLDQQWEESRHALPGGKVRIVARPDLISETPYQPDAQFQEIDDDLSPFIEEDPYDQYGGSDELIVGDGIEDETDRRLIPPDHMMLVTDVPSRFIAKVAPEIPNTGADDVPCLVIRGTKKNARVALKALQELDTLAFGISVEDGRELEIIFGFNGGEQIGVVSIFGTTHDQPLLSEELADALGPDATQVTVVMVGGGTRRPPAQLEASSVVAAVRLGVVHCQISPQ